MQHHHRRRRAHHRDLGGGPRQVDVAVEVLRPHDRVRAAVGFPHHERHLRHGGLHARERELRAAVDQALALLLHTRQVARGVHDVDDGDVVGVAGADEARALVGGVRVNAAGGVHGVVGDEADGAAVDTPECADEVLGVPGLDLDEVLVVAELHEQVHHVVAGVGVVGHEGV